MNYARARCIDNALKIYRICATTGVRTGGGGGGANSKQQYLLVPVPGAPWRRCPVLP